MDLPLAWFGFPNQATGLQRASESRKLMRTEMARTTPYVMACALDMERPRMAGEPCISGVSAGRPLLPLGRSSPAEATAVAAAMVVWSARARLHKPTKEAASSKETYMGRTNSICASLLRLIPAGDGTGFHRMRSVHEGMRRLALESNTSQLVSYL